MALAVAVAHQMREAAEEVVHRMRAMEEEEAEGGLLKESEHSVLVLVAWAEEGAQGWRMDGVDRAMEVVEADQRMEAVQLDLWGEAEGVWQRLEVWHVRDRSLESLVAKTVGELDLAVAEGPPITFSLLGKVVGRQILVLHPLRLL